MITDIRNYVTTCPTCQRNKPTPQPAVTSIACTFKPFQHMTLDWTSGFNVDRNGHDSVLNIVDYFSKWAIVINYLKKMNTTDLIRGLYDRVLSRVG
jgi:hypothetical protein